MRLTDADVKKDLGTAGNNLDNVKFVRNKNYLSQMSTLVQKQERENYTLNAELAVRKDLENENQILKETVMT